MENRDAPPPRTPFHNQSLSLDLPNWNEGLKLLSPNLPRHKPARTSSKLGPPQVTWNETLLLYHCIHCKACTRTLTKVAQRELYLQCMDTQFVSVCSARLRPRSHPSGHPPWQHLHSAFPVVGKDCTVKPLAKASTAFLPESMLHLRDVKTKRVFQS